MLTTMSGFTSKVMTKRLWQPGTEDFRDCRADESVMTSPDVWAVFIDSEGKGRRSRKGQFTRACLFSSADISTT
jgi:hypothetical protein